jgi:hypothetical protein
LLDELCDDSDRRWKDLEDKIVTQNRGEQRRERHGNHNERLPFGFALVDGAEGKLPIPCGTAVTRPGITEASMK